MEQELLKKINQIRVWKPATVINYENPAGFRLIGMGMQGVVFQIDEKRCVKVYYRTESIERELHALQLGGQAGICPEVYFWGHNYIVMEYITAPSLFDYLQKKPLTKSISQRVINLFDTFEKVGYNRFDHSGRHIFLMPDNAMKIIDVVHIIKPQPVFFAKKLITDMGSYAPAFMKHVREISPKWYKQWVSHPEYKQTIQLAKDKAAAAKKK